jgi:beta-glucosidase
MKKLLKILAWIIGGILVLLLAGFAAFQIYYWQINRKAKASLTEKATLTQNGHSFRDLNANGKLDLYEDSRAGVEVRVEDLLAQMTLEEKVGLMWHPPIGVGPNGEILGKPDAGSFFTNSTWNYLVNKKLRHFNLFSIPKSPQLAAWYNKLQKMAEQDRLGIPVTISSDPRHGVTNFLIGGLLDSDFTKWPEPIGLAATGDSSLTVEFGRIANEEYRAVGIRTALHPMADLATEPRWARINGTFGEDAKLSARMTAAYIYGFQGDSLGAGSVACMTKHWPGGGPQENGDDAHFRYGKNQVYPGNNFDYHVVPFEAAFKAHTAMIMPYYGVPVGQTSEDVGMSFNKEIITGLLRKQYGFDGVVCTDWGILKGFDILGKEIVGAKDYGVYDRPVKDRTLKAIEAGVDQFGGNDLTDELLELVRDGVISELRIDQSVRRLLRAKFRLGLFDNPYVDESKVPETVGRSDFVEKGLLAQKKSIVLLKNDTLDGTPALPLRKQVKVYVENLSKDAISKYATITDSLADADFAILRMQTPWQPRSGDIVESFFHQGHLDFPERERSRLLGILAKKPAIVCIYMDRPAVMPEIAAKAAGLFVDFGISDEALLSVVFGEFNPTGRLPFEIPSLMEAVEKQKEDMPYDSENPLFEFGAGRGY